MTAATTLIIGATGNTGKSVVNTLSKLSNTTIIALTRSLNNPIAKDLEKLPNTQVIEKDWTTVDVDFLKSHNIQKVFVASHNLPSHFTDESLLYTAALHAGVKYVVRISTFVHFIGPASPIYYGRNHWAIENLLSQPEFKELQWTSLQPNFFGNTFLVTAALWLNKYKETGEKDTLKMMLDEKEPVAMIDPDDVGVFAGHLLNSSDYTQHNHAKYVLAGPENENGRSVVEAVEQLAKTKVDKVEYRCDDWLEMLPSMGYAKNVMPSIAKSSSLFLWTGRGSVESSPNSKEIWSMKKEAENGQKKKPKTSAAQLRVQKDITELELPSTMSTNFPNPSDLLNFELIIQPDEGMYKGGSFKFTFNISNNYPHEAPKVKLTQKIYHPNLDHQGNVCLNILREDWKPVLNLNALVVGLQYLFLEPNAEDPLNKDAANDLLRDRNQFKSWVAASMSGKPVKDFMYFTRSSPIESPATSMSTPRTVADAHLPRIPTSIFNAPSQRLLALSALTALQAYKLSISLSLWSTQSSTRLLDSEIALYRWSLIDLSAILLIWWLRIPRLRFHKSVWVAAAAAFFAFDWFLLGSWKLPVTQLSTLIIPSSLLNAFTFYKTPQEHSVRLKDVIGNRDSHLRGEHTVRVGGFSTAKLNPTTQSFCVPIAPTNPIALPILFNNTDPLVLAYSVTPLNHDGSLAEESQVEIQGRELEKSRLGYADDDDDFFDPNHDLYSPHDELALLPRGPGVSAPPRLQKTQNIRYIPLNPSSLPPPPFIVRLKHVVDKSSELDARLARTEAVVVECPSAGFASDQPTQPNHGDRCVGDKVGLQLGVRSAGGASVGWISRGPEGSDLRKLDNIGSTAYTTSAAHARAVSTTTSIPINVTLDRAGAYSLELASLADFFANEPYPSLYESGLQHASSSVHYNSHPRPVVQFAGCTAEQPVRLLEGEKASAELSVSVGGISPAEGDVDVSVTYFDNPDLQRSGASTPLSVHIPAGHTHAALRVTRPGYYKMEEVRGEYCIGATHLPDVCGVQTTPRPTLNMDIRTIEDCSGEVGIRAQMALTGAAPFTLAYLVEFAGEAKRVEKRIHASRDELSLTPEREGEYKYTFLALSDANYRDIALGERGEGITATQVVHPLAGASFAEPSTKRTVWSCESGTIDVQVEFTGSGPWTLEYQTSGTSASSIAAPTAFSEKDIHNRRHTLAVPIPADIDRLGGQFRVSLAGVEDSRRCRKALAQDYTVVVQRVKPTARLSGATSATVRDGESAYIPVRVTGDPPWVVGYEHGGQAHTVTTHSRQTDLVVDSEGLYRLTEVRDAHCPGTVVTGEDSFALDFIPRPSLSLGKQTQTQEQKRKHHHTLPPVCTYDDSAVSLAISGEPPFEVVYEHTHSGARVDERIASVRQNPLVSLDTAVAGTHVYRFAGVGDANYALAGSGSAQVQVEQVVVERPYAQFAHTPRASYCLGDVLAPREHATHPTHTPLIELHGTAPWVLDLEVVEEGGAHARRVSVRDIREPLWALDLSPLRLLAFGAHRISIVGVHDASACVADGGEESSAHRRSTLIDVAESATVVPRARAEDVCVGDSMDFQLGGSAPWVVRYEWDGVTNTVKSRSALFSRVAEEEGRFAITEVSHHSQRCPSAVDIRRSVHPLPAASVSEGDTYIEDIREGDQAEIRFSFTGTPPFTFTYERRENIQRGRSHELGRVLERHTVTDIMEHEHSIYSSLEGELVQLLAHTH
ncbi:hypothetical protein E3P78_03893 [Wallemia ichthyophaga]|nr:hypothetical protein E3P78_03893 [Wallemia ichthyophaga]